MIKTRETHNSWSQGPSCSSSSSFENENHIPIQNGLFVKANINGIEMNCLIDTGFTITVMHLDKFNLLPVADKPKIITDNVQLKMADGGDVCYFGYEHLPLEINGKIFQQRSCSSCRSSFGFGI